MLKTINFDNVTSRQLTAGHVPTLEFPHSWQPPSKHFVVFIAADSRDLTAKQISDFATAALKAGAVYFVCWGPDCEAMHDVIDGAIVSLIDETDETVVLTTWHEEENLADAVWFAVNVAMPAPAYENSCCALVAVVVDNEPWAIEVESWLGDVGALSERVCGK